MDNKVTKKRLNDHLEYDWFKYVIILLASILVGYFVFNQINANRDYETVNIFMSCYGTYSNDYEAQTKKDMKQKMDKSVFGGDYIRQIAVESQDPAGKDYFTLFQTHGQQTSDILILGESLLKDANSLGYVTLTDDILTKYIIPEPLTINDFDYLTFTNKETGVVSRQGIRVDTFRKLKGDGGAFELNWENVDAYKDKEWGEKKPDKVFYMVFNRLSVNIGEYGSKKAKRENKQAFYCANRLIQYYRS